MSQLGDLFKSYRLERQLSQKEVSQGICTQAIVSKIEKGETTPSVEIFFKLAKRLDIPEGAILDLFDYHHQYKINRVYTEAVKEAVYKGDYVTVYQLLETTKTLTLSPLEQLYFRWLTGVLKQILFNQYEESIAILTSLLEEVTEGEFHYLVRHSLAVIYMEVEQYQASKAIIESIGESYRLFSDEKFKWKCLYTKARLHYLSKEYDVGLQVTSSAIKESIEAGSLYLIANFYYLEGAILSELALFEDALISFDKADFFYDLENNDYMKKQTKLSRKIIEEKMS